MEILTYLLINLLLFLVVIAVGLYFCCWVGRLRFGIQLPLNSTNYEYSPAAWYNPADPSTPIQFRTIAAPEEENNVMRETSV